MFDYVWYTTGNGDAALKLLNIPSIEDRTRRRKFGIAWAPNQPRPLTDSQWLQYREKKPITGDDFEWKADESWNWMFGNFLGMENDPDKARSECMLSQIQPGIVGGIIRDDVRTSESFKNRVALAIKKEEERVTKLEENEAIEREQLETLAILELWITVAKRVGIDEPENLSPKDLYNQIQLSKIMNPKSVPNDDQVREWIALKVPQVEDLKTIENTPDWENYLSSAYASVVAVAQTKIAG